MAANNISESGMISADGRLLLPMERINAFFAEHKGERLVVRFTADVPGSTNAQQTYYYQYVLPTIRQAFKDLGERKTETQIDRFLVGLYPGDKSEQQIGLGTDVEEARHFDRGQMSEFLDWLKQYAAENLYVYIEDPKTL